MDSTLEQPYGMVIKKEAFTDEYSLCKPFLKEEVASIYDEEESILNSSFDNGQIKTESGYVAENDIECQEFLEDKKISSTVYSVDSQHLLQDEDKPFIDESQIKRRRKKTNIKDEIKLSSETTGIITKSGRIRRDDIFKNKKYFCCFCQKSYLGRKMFKNHFKIHFSQTGNQFLCLVCKCTFHTVSHMNRHIMDTHFLLDIEDEKLFACTLCEKRFHCLRDLERHMNHHTGEGRLSCAECGDSFTQKCHLQSHIYTAHGYPMDKTTQDNSLFICNDCNYKSKEKSSLREHIKRHIGYKSFKCPECNYSCTSGGDLQKHITIHSESRPFVCNWCRKTFKRRSHLLIHFNAKYDCIGKKGFIKSND